MKQLILLVFCTTWLFSADAQSQTITGTLLPKKGSSIEYLPKASKVQQDTIGIVKTPVAAVEKHPVKTKSAVPKTRIPFDSKGFVFKMPVVQGQKNGSLPAQENTQLANTIDSVKTFVNVSQPISVQKLTPTTADGPLKYEEPPTNQSSKPSADLKSTTQLEPLVYGPPPSNNNDINKQNGTGNYTDASKATSLRSPTFIGEYKPSLKQPILLVPVAADQLENGVLKSKKSVETAPVDIQKSIEDLYPPLNYSAPPSAAAANLKSPKIQGVYVATKNNATVLLPVAPNVYTEPPSTLQDASTNYNPNTIDVINKSSNRKEQVSQASIFHDNIPKITKASNNTKPQSQVEEKSIFDNNGPKITKTANNTTPQIQAEEKSIFDDNGPVTVVPKVYRRPQKQVAKPATFGNKFKFQKPVKQSLYNKTLSVNGKVGSFMKPIKQSAGVVGTSNTAVSNNQPTDNIIQKDLQVSHANYKFYLNRNGKYNVAFDEGGSNVTLTSFGRVADFYSNGSVMPVYNYKGLLESVGNLKIQYTYEGRVAAVGATQIGYNYDGVIESVGNTPIYVNSNGTVDKIGDSKVAYDDKGNITNLDKNAMILVKQ